MANFCLIECIECSVGMSNRIELGIELGAALSSSAFII